MSAANSITEQILQRFVELLEAQGAPQEATVSRSRRTAVSPDELPMYCVTAVHEDAATNGNPRRPMLMDRTLTVDVSIRVLGTDADADEHRNWVVGQLVTDPTLSGLVRSCVEQSTDWVVPEGTDGSLLIVGIRFAVEYSTKPNDLRSVK